MDNKQSRYDKYCELVRLGWRDKEIRKELGMACSTSSAYLKRMGLSRRDRIKFQFNEDLFKTWSSESAYFYGYLIGDGSISGKKQVVQIQSIDREHLETLNKMLNNRYKISIARKSNSIIRNGKVWNAKEIYSLSFADPVLIEDLLRLGYSKNKSKLGCKYPDVPKRLLFEFLSGLLAADGCVCKPNNGTIRIMWWVTGDDFKEKLIKDLNMPVSVSKVSKKYPIYVITVGKKVHVREIYEKFKFILYFSERKFKILKEYFNE